MTVVSTNLFHKYILVFQCTVQLVHLQGKNSNNVLTVLEVSTKTETVKVHAVVVQWEPILMSKVF